MFEQNHIQNDGACDERLLGGRSVLRAENLEGYEVNKQGI